MRTTILTLALLLVSQFSFAQNAEALYNSLKDLDGVEAMSIPTFIMKPMMKKMAKEAKAEGSTFKLDKWRMLYAEENIQAFEKALHVELQKLLTNGFQKRVKALNAKDSAYFYVLGDGKISTEMVSFAVDANNAPLVIIFEGKFADDKCLELQTPTPPKKK